MLWNFFEYSLLLLFQKFKNNFSSKFRLFSVRLKSNLWTSLDNFLIQRVFIQKHGNLPNNLGDLYYSFRASLVAQMVKNLPAMWETWVRSLDQEDPLEEEMATPSSILAWNIHGHWYLVSYSSWGHKSMELYLVTKLQQRQYNLKCGNG